MRCIEIRQEYSSVWTLKKINRNMRCIEIESDLLNKKRAGQFRLIETWDVLKYGNSQQHTG